MSEFEIVGKGQYPQDYRDKWTEEVIENNSGKTTIRYNKRELTLSEKSIRILDEYLQPQETFTDTTIQVLSIYLAGSLFVRGNIVIVSLFGLTGIILTLLPTVFVTSLLIAGLRKPQYRLPLTWRILVFLLGGI